MELNSHQGLAVGVVTDWDSGGWGRVCLLAETFLESFEANGSRRWMAGLTWNRTVLGLDLCLPVLCIRVHTRSPEMPGGTTVLHPVWKDELVAHFTMPITEDLSGNPWRMLSVTPPSPGLRAAGREAGLRGGTHSRGKPAGETVKGLRWCVWLISEGCAVYVGRERTIGKQCGPANGPRRVATPHGVNRSVLGRTAA